MIVPPFLSKDTILFSPSSEIDPVTSHIWELGHFYSPNRVFTLFTSNDAYANLRSNHIGWKGLSKNGSQFLFMFILSLLPIFTFCAKEEEDAL